MRLAGLILGGMMLLQAPIVRRLPEMKGTQAPQGPEATQQQVPQNSDGQKVPSIRVQTRLVNVALNVVDATGAPVGGLGKDDFEILEDGKVPRNRRSGDGESGGNLPGGKLAALQFLKDLAAGRVRKGTENLGHRFHI